MRKNKNALSPVRPPSGDKILKKETTEMLDVPGLVRLSDDADETGQLVVTEKNNILLYNNRKGNLIVLRLKDSKEFNTGRERLVGANFEGLGLVVEKKDGLYFWEKKNLVNKMRRFGGTRETNHAFQKVLFSRDSVYYTEPGAKGNHRLMRYDYINRKNITLLEENKKAILDITPDGKFLLLISPNDKCDWVIFNIYRKKIQTANLKRPGTIIGFGRNVEELLLENNGKIETERKLKDRKMLMVLGDGASSYSFVTASRDHSFYLFYDNLKKAYFVIRVGTDHLLPIKGKLPKIDRAAFSYDNKVLYFISNGVLYKYEAAGDPDCF